MKFNKNMKLKDIVQDHPNSMDVFHKFNMDYCCGGEDTVEVSASKEGLSVDEILSALESIDESNEVNQGPVDLDTFKTFTTEEMIDSLKLTHHKDELEMIAELDPLILKILKVHYTHHKDQLIEVHRIFGQLKTELEAHFIKEEVEVFPLMLEHPNPTQDIVDQITTLEGEHELAGELLKAMTEVTNYFTPPADACATYKRTFSILETLVHDVYLHVFKENNLLFPKYESRVEE